MRVPRKDGPQSVKTLWPDTREEDPNLPPRKSEEQREADSRLKWSNPLHDETKVASGDGRRKDAPFMGEKRRTYIAPTPMPDGSNPVSFYGTASRGVPREWGESLGARIAQRYEVERTLRDGSKVTRILARPVMATLRGADGKKTGKIQVGWKGGVERVNVPGKGVFAMYPGSDRTPCHGSGESTAIVRGSEERMGKRGPYTADVYRATCKGCGCTRDVPHKVAKAGAKVWEFPYHAQSRKATPVRVTHPDVEKQQREAWTVEDWGATTLAAGAAQIGDTRVKSGIKTDTKGQYFETAAVIEDPQVRGMRKTRELYRTMPVVGSVAYKAPVVKGASPGVSVRGKIGTNDVSARKAADVVRKTMGTHPVMCDARNAPPRQIHAF